MKYISDTDELCELSNEEILYLKKYFYNLVKDDNYFNLRLQYINSKLDNNCIINN